MFCANLEPMIEENLARIKERISRVCQKVNRNPNEVIIVAVAKEVGIKEIEEVINCGIIDIGENRLQEAILKYHQLSTVNCQLSTIKWHMVGHLQTNKVKEAVEIFDLIHSVNSLRLAQFIDKEANKINKIQDILIQVNTSKETTKFGLKDDEVIDAVKEIVKFKNINLKGLMTIAPFVDNPGKTHPYFRKLRELRDQINTLSTIDCRLSTLSMGMTDDFEVAIEEGSTMIRLGRAVFKN